jgi:hypothetical protein
MQMKRYLSSSLMAALTFAFFTSPAMAQKNSWTLSFPESKDRFVKVQQEWAKKDPYWKPTKEDLEAMFDKFDTDKDGKLTEEEWNNRKGAKPKKEKAKK